MLRLASKPTRPRAYTGRQTLTVSVSRKSASVMTTPYYSIFRVL
jgi:hypothetical protein